MKSFDRKKYATFILHKVSRYTKQQKLFVLYLFVLLFAVLVMPIIIISPVDPDSSSRFVFLLSGSLGFTGIIIFLSLIILLAWNTSFRFKNFVTSHFGFKENEHLLNFAFLSLIACIYISFGDVISIFTETTSIRISNFGYNVVLVVLLVGLVINLISLIKQAKLMNKNKIVNITSGTEEKISKSTETVKSLFGDK